MQIGAKGNVFKRSRASYTPEPYSHLKNINYTYNRFKKANPPSSPIKQQKNKDFHKKTK